MRLLCFVFCLWIPGLRTRGVRTVPDSEGPVFTHEPPLRVDFANSTGARVECSARGYPPPSVTWVGADGGSLHPLPHLRQTLPNGTLLFHPFSAEDYRADVHSSTYRCLAGNPSGIIASRHVHVRAVVLQTYEIQVYDEYVIRGNTAVMKCHIPSFVKDYVKVTSWLQETDYGLATPLDTGGRFLLMSTGELHIFEVDPSDGSQSYRCRTIHRLTGEIRISATSHSGRLYVTEPRGSVTPRITDSKPSVQAFQGEAVFLSCAAQGFPIPNYSWFAKVSDLETIPISSSDRIHLISGTLVIANVQILDAGTYVCEVTNSMSSVRIETILSVSAPLSAYIYPQRQVVDLGQSATLSCVVSGYPIMHVTWLKDGHPLLTDTINHVSQEVLRLEAVRKADRGMYQCVVTNQHEVAQGTAELRLGDSPPEFQRLFLAKVVEQGANVALECVVSGNPTPEVVWMLDGNRLPEVNRLAHTEHVDVHGDVISRVNLTRAKVEDGGEYRCVARNPAGQVEHGARLNVQGPPYIRLKSQMTVVAGMDLALNCHVAGHPIEAILWEKEQRVLPVNHRQKVFANGTLVVRNVQRSDDGGRYTCLARGELGHTDRRDVEVIVMAPPKIIPFSFQDDHLREGFRARIQCVLSEGDLPIAITWLKDGRSLPPQSGISVRDLDDFSSMLTVSSVSSRHNGNYTCVASNRAASISFTTELLVNVPPTILPFSFQDAQLQEGMRAQVTCALSQGDQPIHLKWVKDGHPIPPSLHVVVRNFDEYTSSLSIESVSSRHGGNYTCTATNPAAQVYHTARLVVNVPPRWLTQPQNAYVLQGGNIVLPCQADGFPKPTVSWAKAVGDTPGDYRELEPRGNSARFRILEDGSLMLSEARESDAGFYLCKANNGIGAGLSEVVFLSVHVPAYFQIKMMNVTAKIGEDAQLMCEALGDKPLSVTWSVNKQHSRADTVHRYKVSENPWDKGMVSELLIEGVTRKDSGSYPCIAKNTHGHEEASVRLIVQEPPEAPINIRATESTSRSIHLSWTPGYDGNSPVTQYIVQYKELARSWTEDSHNLTVFSQTTSYAVERLQPATRYHVRLYAKNELGTSGPSQEIEMQTGMEAPGGPPLHVRVEAVDSSTLTVFWKPPRQEVWNGKISGYKVGFKLHESEQQEYTVRTVSLQAGEELLNQLRLPLANLKKYTKYSVVVQAFNQLGTGPPSEEVVARTAEDVPSKAPDNVRCSALSSQGVSISWEPPPPLFIHGQLLGYKVLYKPVTDWYDEFPSEIKISQTWKTTLHGLDKFRNYSIQVLAFTRVGDGAKSSPVFCQTREDVPEAPADIKALVLSVDTVAVVWKSPTRTNGVIIKYTVYTRSTDTGKEETNKYIVSNNATLLYEARGLRKNRRYEFWVTASTTVGEGQSTKPVAQTPSPRVPARILAFDASVVCQWKENVTLRCRSAGIPTPEVDWRFGNKIIQQTERIQMRVTGALQIFRVQSADAGLYTCRVQNIHGSDAIAYTLVVQAPPPAPNVIILSSSFTTIELQWKSSSDGGSPIQGYTLHYKRDFGDWEAIQLGARHDHHVLDNLWCGTRYQVFMTSWNKIGDGDASDTKSIRTRGSAPEMPTKSKLVQENSTFITLNLDAWTNGGCPILYFVIEYKLQTRTEWMLVSNNVKVQVHQEKYIILDLHAGTRYNLRVTAHNSAGSTIAEYEFVTPIQTSRSGAYPGRDMQQNQTIPFYLDVNITGPIAALLIILLLSSVTLFCWKRRKDLQSRQQQQSDGSNLQGKQYEAHYVVSSDKKSTLLKSNFDKGSFTCLLVNTEGASDGSANNTPRHVKRVAPDEIQPYATYQLPGCKTEGFTSEDWKRYEVYNPGHQTLRAVRVASSNVYPHLKKENECATGGPDSSLSDDQEYASPVRSSDTSDSTSGTNQQTEADAGMRAPCRQPPKPRKPGRRAKVPDLIYRRHGECAKLRSSDLQPFPEVGEPSGTTLDQTPIKIPRPQLERPTAPTEATIETTFSFLDQLGLSQESSDTPPKNYDPGMPCTSSNSTNSKDSST